jgi:hypothetical protein
MLRVSRPLIRNVRGEWATARFEPERNNDRPKSNNSISSVMRRKALARRFRTFQGDPIIVSLDSAVAAQVAVVRACLRYSTIDG